MGKYIFYYNLASSGIVNSIEAAQELKSMMQLKDLMGKMSSPEDSITIYDKQDRVRSMIWADDNSSYVLEIHNAAKGVNFHRKFQKEDLLMKDLSIIKSYIELPEENGFEVESF